jgi:hypothetical protein
MSVDLEWPWALPLVGLVVLAALASARPRRDRASDVLLVSHVERLRAMPRFQALLRGRRRAAAVVTLAALLVAAGAGIALARPEVDETQPREARSRDLMLCLDASPSMAKDNAEVVRQLRRVTEGLRDDRIGLVIWSGAAVVVFPLTDDADFIRGQLDRAEAAFTGDPQRFYAGTTRNDFGQSLIGDGLVSCVNRFDGASRDRTRAVILVSDNDPYGERLYSLPEAAALAEDHDVLVYGLAASWLARPKHAEALAEMDDAVRSTGGVLAQLGDPGGSDRIIQRIDDLEKARADERPRRVSRDSPGLGLGLAGAGLLLLVLGWVLPLLPRRRSRG